MISANLTGHEIASSLGWDPADLRIREISRGDTTLNVARAVIAGKPAVLFAQVVHRNGYDPLQSAALYAYHSNVDWGLVSDHNGVRIFNSHRLVEREWLTLPPVPWANISEAQNVILALSPQGLVDGAIETIAARAESPTSILKPIDDRLVERLDAWRDQAVRYSRNSDGVDEKLQTLFAQMFVLRAVEDRNLSPEIPDLLSVRRDADNIDVEAWAEILSQARVKIGSDLFEKNALEGVPAHVASGVIHDLYYPGLLPDKNTRYNFSWIEADVLGAAYEKYLATILHPLPTVSQAELFHTPQHDVERLSVRRKSGTFYTPPFIHDYLAAKSVGEFYDVHAEDAIPKVIDFSCGSGSFLVAAVDQMLRKLKQVDPNRRWAKEIVQGGHIAGIDINPKTVSIARLRLWHRLVEEPDALPLPDLSACVIAADGLNADTWGDLPRSFDIVLGNPPFLATTRVDDNAGLTSRFESASGRFDFSSLFVEQAVRVLNPDGIMGLVVPNRLFINANAAAIRSILVAKTQILTLVDFKSTKPFIDASAYIGCIIARKSADEDGRPDLVRVVEVQSLEPDFLAAILLDADNSDFPAGSAVKAYWARHPSSSSAWLLISEDTMRVRVMFENATSRLEEIATIKQGIRTGGNDLFVFDVISNDDHLSVLVNGLGEGAVIENELLRPVMYGSEIARYSEAVARRQLLYTYRNEVVLSDSILQERYPKAWSYLRRNEAILASRSSVTGGKKWYELIRPRSEDWLRLPKLLIRDLAQRTSFAVDLAGGTYIVGGTAVVPVQADLCLALMAYLNSGPINTYLKGTTPEFRGSFQKFEPQHLEGVPVLTELLDGGEFFDALTDLAKQRLVAESSGNEELCDACESQIDQQVRAAAVRAGVPLDQ